MTIDGIYLGLMSGTSADAIDAVAVDFSFGQLRIIAHHSEPLQSNIRGLIHQLATPGDNEIDRLGDLDNQLGELFAGCVNTLLKDSELDSADINAIGSHGQTIRHRPPVSSSNGFTLQIGNPNIIAHHTSITTIADFRRRDMAAGGQGAPLVPAFHHAAFHSDDCDRVIINIGGIANITWLPAKGNILGFDTGPGNVLMDGWILQNLGKPYDVNGAWAASGQIDYVFLNKLLKHPFFQQSHPKSSGREDFNPAWLKAELAEHYPANPPEDIQATLLALTAQSIADCVKILVSEDNTEVYICGGGAYNSHLLAAIKAMLPGCSVNTTAKLGIAPEWIEAVAFAWLARQTLNRKSGNLCTVTGARQAAILGGIYYA